MPRRSWILGVDVGGTFTDAVAMGSDGAATVAKVASTPADPAIGLLSALGELGSLGVPLEDVDLLVHGTTIATNAVITGRSARVVLLAKIGRASCRERV